MSDQLIQVTWARALVFLKLGYTVALKCGEFQARLALPPGLREDALHEWTEEYGCFVELTQGNGQALLIYAVNPGNFKP